MRRIAVLDYGSGNLASVEFALERLDARAERVSTPDAVAGAERLVLPGVGAAGFAMARLSAAGLIEAVRAFPRPLLGICLGQQLLFERSDEDEADLLGLLPGRVRRLEPGEGLTVPHMGWSRLVKDRDDPLMDGIGDDAWAYFVHGYVCPDGPATIAHATYGGRVPAVVGQGRRYGCQFHPERSAQAGALILRNFLELPA